jgi:hypothetical protein
MARLHHSRQSKKAFHIDIHPLDFHHPLRKGVTMKCPAFPLTLTNSSRRGQPRPLLGASNHPHGLARFSQGGALFPAWRTGYRHPRAHRAAFPPGPLVEAKLK